MYLETLYAGSGRSVGQNGAVASVATATAQVANDETFIVTANVLVTVATNHTFTVTCTYTDEGNSSRTATMNFQIAAGTLGTSITNTNGAVPYMGIPLMIRAKAGTAITVATTGTFTTVTYNVDARIQRLGA